MSRRSVQRSAWRSIFRDMKPSEVSLGEVLFWIVLVLVFVSLW